jgi:hypothetical protein
MQTERAKLPVVYHENVLCLLVQKPDVLFTYWDLSPGHLEIIDRQKKLILCLYKEGFLDKKIDLPPFTNSWYFRQVEPGCVYFCELGIDGGNDAFIPLLRSGSISTPRLAVIEEESWETGRVDVYDAAKPLPEGGKDNRTTDIFSSISLYMGYKENGQ